MIVINWNSRDQTLQCLQAVERETASVPGSAITVVDNGSRDGSIAAVRKHHPSARFLPLGTNRGFTGGVAAGLLNSQGRYVVLLNNDALPEPGWLGRLVSAIEQAPDDVIGAAGRIVSIDGQRIDFIGGILTFDGHAFQDGFRMPLGARPEPAPGADLLFACGGNMIVRRKEFVELGGFDDDYFAYLEDVDFGWRAWISGYRFIYEPEATVRHHSSATSNRLGDFERGVLFERNALVTTIKNYENFRENASAVLLTYLHRLHHYATKRNPGAAELSRRPGDGTPRKTTGVLGRITGKVRGSRPLVAIDDPLTAMQFRALDWVLANEETLLRKREMVQKRRVRSDREIFERFPLSIVPTYPGDDRLMRGGLFGLVRSTLPAVERELGDIIAR